MAGKWSDDDKRKIFDVFCVLAASVNGYGNIDHKARLRSWQMILENDMTADQICAAMITHARTSEEIPTPAHLLAYVKPPEKQITYAEYKHALEQHALEGFPMFGYYGQVIKDYERQRNEDTGAKSYYEILEARQAAQIKLSPEVKKILVGTMKTPDDEKENDHDR